jgi:Cof subfamily protein (haloacid dehalogenase superfamily)
MSPPLARPIRLLVSDVDGTLVRPDKSLAPATIEAVRRLLHAQVAMTLISARPPSGILPLAKQLGLTAPIGAFNGGTLVAADGTILSAHHLAAEASRTATEIVGKSGAAVWLFADGRWFATDPGGTHIAREILSAMVEPVFGADLSALHGRVDKIVAVSDDPALMERLEGELGSRLGAAAEVSLSQPYYCDITHRLANKGDGIAALAAHIDVPLAETAAIGDMANDIPMLRRAAVAIAMGQAPDTVKAAAGWVSTANDADGVAHAIDHILLPEIARHRL